MKRLTKTQRMALGLASAIERAAHVAAVQVSKDRNTRTNAGRSPALALAEQLLVLLADRVAR